MFCCFMRWCAIKELHTHSLLLILSNLQLGLFSRSILVDPFWKKSEVWFIIFTQLGVSFQQKAWCNHWQYYILLVEVFWHLLVTVLLICYCWMVVTLQLLVYKVGKSSNHLIIITVHCLLSVLNWIGLKNQFMSYIESVLIEVIFPYLLLL